MFKPLKGPCPALSLYCAHEQFILGLEAGVISNRGLGYGLEDSGQEDGTEDAEREMASTLPTVAVFCIPCPKNTS